MNKDNKEISKATLNRLPSYLKYLYQLDKLNVATVSSTTIANGLNLNPVQVRKDIALVSSVAGKPKMGYVTNEIIADLESFLGYNNTHDAVLVGVGGLGKAFLGYGGFENYGLNIVAAFDTDPAIVGGEISGIPIYHANRLAEICQGRDIAIAALTVPVSAAQAAADAAIDAGIRGIWNFTPCRIRVHGGAVVQNTSMYSHLAVMYNRLQDPQQ